MFSTSYASPLISCYQGPFHIIHRFCETVFDFTVFIALQGKLGPSMVPRACCNTPPSSKYYETWCPINGTLHQNSPVKQGFFKIFSINRNQKPGYPLHFRFHYAPEGYNLSMGGITCCILFLSAIVKWKNCKTILFENGREQKNFYGVFFQLILLFGIA